MTTRYICKAIDSIGIASYLSMVEEVDENGNVELIVMPTYQENDAYKFNDRESAEQATKEWLYPNLIWEAKEVQD